MQIKVSLSLSGKQSPRFPVFREASQLNRSSWHASPQKEERRNKKREPLRAPIQIPFRSPYIYIYPQTSIYIGRGIFSQRLNIDWLSLYSLRFGYGSIIGVRGSTHFHLHSIHLLPGVKCKRRRESQKWFPPTFQPIHQSFFHFTTHGPHLWSDFAKFQLENDGGGHRLILICILCGRCFSRPVRQGTRSQTITTGKRYRRPASLILFTRQSKNQIEQRLLIRSPSEIFYYHDIKWRGRRIRCQTTSQQLTFPDQMLSSVSRRIRLFVFPPFNITVDHSCLHAAITINMNRLCLLLRWVYIH